MTAAAALHAVAYCAVTIFLLTVGGNLLCRMLFKLSGLSGAGLPKDSVTAGRWIGAFERLIIGFGVIAHSWEVLAAVIALKTVARFKELDKKLPAEYFLVGSLFSIIWSVLVSASWLAYDREAGARLYDRITPIFAAANGTNCRRVDQNRCEDSSGDQLIIGNIFG